ncbi:hypothetical protein HMPREF0880_03246 [Yokenella regensburgei ATCC 43003]|nr:hypothetical protein HMPREF0880_03246 [Yokenella regensburgei ATCC 43003]
MKIRRKFAGFFFSAPPPVMFFTLLYKDKKQEMPGQITQSSASGNAIYCRY